MCWRDGSLEVCSSEPTVPEASLVNDRPVIVLAVPAPSCQFTSTLNTSWLPGSVSVVVSEAVWFSRIVVSSGSEKIGRASCRERGEISVVGGSLKKKKG